MKKELNWERQTEVGIRLAAHKNLFFASNADLQKKEKIG